MFFLWTYFLMTLCRLTEPGPEVPWADTYFTSAAAIANAAVNEPLGARNGKPDEGLTVAVLVVMAWNESRFDPKAVGDGGGSLGMFQVSPGTAGIICSRKAKAFTDEEKKRCPLFEPENAARIALRLIHQSFSICRNRPVEERLGWYMRGGNGCDERLEKSRSRMNKAASLLREHPVGSNEGREEQ